MRKSLRKRWKKPRRRWSLGRKSRKKRPRRPRAKRAKKATAFSGRRRFPELGKLDTNDVGLVVGLGNPGRGHRANRHNAGFMVSDRILARSEKIVEGKWPEGHLAFVRVGPFRFLVLKPTTYMNESGLALAPVLEHYKISPVRVVAIHDDIDIPLGDIKVKLGGGSGGHRGIESLESRINDHGFWRVRIGIGRPPEGMEPTDYVLSDFSEGELRELPALIEDAAEAALELLNRREATSRERGRTE